MCGTSAGLGPADVPRAVSPGRAGLGWSAARVCAELRRVWGLLMFRGPCRRAGPGSGGRGPRRRWNFGGSGPPMFAGGVLAGPGRARGGRMESGVGRKETRGRYPERGVDPRPPRGGRGPARARSPRRRPDQGHRSRRTQPSGTIVERTTGYLTLLHLPDGSRRTSGRRRRSSMQMSGLPDLVRQDPDLLMFRGSPGQRSQPAPLGGGIGHPAPHRPTEPLHPRCCNANPT